MTAEALESYRGRMSEEAFRVASYLVGGWTMHDIMAEMGMGPVKYMRLALQAEGVVGERLRGKRGNRGKRTQHTARAVSGGTVRESPGVRCSVCRLLEPHTCMEVSMRRVWDGEYPVPRGTD